MKIKELELRKVIAESIQKSLNEGLFTHHSILTIELTCQSRKDKTYYKKIIKMPVTQRFAGLYSNEQLKDGLKQAIKTYTAKYGWHVVKAKVIDEQWL